MSTPFSQGSYTNSQPTTDNDLYKALVKYPEIIPTIIRQFPMYSMTNMTQGLGNLATKATVVGNRQIRWATMGRIQQSSTFVSSSGTGAGNQPFTIVLLEGTNNPYEVLRFKGNQQVVIQGVPPVAVSGGYQYQVIGDGWGSSTTFDTTNITAGTTCGVVGTKFPEKSTRGYGTTKFPDQWDNYTTISRGSASLTRTAGTDKTWFKFPVTLGGKSGYSEMWTYEAIAQALQNLLYNREKNAWFGNRTVTTDTQGNPTYNTVDFDGSALISGDGFINQIWSNNIATYTGTLTETFICNYLGQLMAQSGVTGKQTYLVDTASGGFNAFDRAMKNFWVASGHAIIWNADTKSNLELGGIYKSYVYGNATMLLNENPVFEDPTLNNSYVNGFPQSSYTMVFRNITDQGQGQDVKCYVKGMEQGNAQSIITKKIVGMWDIDGSNSETAANGFDGCDVEFLTESAICVGNNTLHGIVYRN